MRKIILGVATTLAATVAAIGLTIVAPSSAQADITQSGFYKTTYSDVVYRYFNYGNGSVGQYPITYSEWASYGYPQPQIVRSEVVKYAWSPTLYAVTFFAGDWEWHRLNEAEWWRMGFQAPYNAGWIEESEIYQFSSGPELFLRGEDGSVHKLTYSEWQATRRGVDYRSDVGYVRFYGNPVIYEVWDYGTYDEWGYPLTYAEWAAEGFPTPAVRW